jgi:hypothetical protein
MLRRSLGAIVFVLGLTGLARAQYYDGYHSSTAAEGAAHGMADMARSAGAYNVLTSQAALNMTQVEREQMDNRLHYTQTYLAIKREGEQYRAEHKKPPPTAEELTRWSQSRKPKPLAESQFDPATGALVWPDALQSKDFAEGRKALDGMMVQRAAYGGLSAVEKAEVKQQTDAMLAKLDEQIRDLSPSNYMAGRKMLESLRYEATKPVDAGQMTLTSAGKKS